MISRMILDHEQEAHVSSRHKVEMGWHPLALHVTLALPSTCRSGVYCFNLKRSTQGRSCRRMCSTVLGQIEFDAALELLTQTRRSSRHGPLSQRAL
jgi:hypothetical protein